MAESIYAENYALAVQGESFAADVYTDLGYDVVARNVRTRVGEIDLIVRDADGVIVFVEVKARRGRAFGAAEAVTAKKLNTMRRCAAQWLAGRPYSAVRFDVAEVIVSGGEMSIHLFKDVDDGSC
ncbi:putative endonuclease [Corynebacterium mycetoides]|uniref:UPF0102 protein SAMN04488535_0830 n=1 Tax=Corynebacterium mycetoides TaxID=38302 RepID=A0A1G9N188_9CORY|nr:YraN family protein [Corynebacterium mycetoides]SDL80280.1 putative endonuclease [Corynebacterium mycetoides]